MKLFRTFNTSAKPEARDTALDLNLQILPQPIIIQISIPSLSPGIKLGAKTSPSHRTKKSLNTPFKKKI